MKRTIKASVLVLSAILSTSAFAKVDRKMQSQISNFEVDAAFNLKYLNEYKKVNEHNGFEQYELKDKENALLFPNQKVFLNNDRTKFRFVNKFENKEECSNFLRNEAASKIFFGATAKCRIIAENQNIIAKIYENEYSLPEKIKLSYMNKDELNSYVEKCDNVFLNDLSKINFNTNVKNGKTVLFDHGNSVGDYSYKATCSDSGLYTVSINNEYLIKQNNQ